MTLADDVQKAVDEEIELFNGIAALSIDFPRFTHYPERGAYEVYIPFGGSYERISHYCELAGFRFIRRIDEVLSRFLVLLSTLFFSKRPPNGVFWLRRSSSRFGFGQTHYRQ